MKYEIINPSDPYTMEADNLLVAAAAITLLGRGKYPLDAMEEGAPGVPFFVFGGLNEWWDKRSPETSLSDFITENMEEIAAALESVTLGCEEPSSLNDIGSNARTMAGVLREKAAAARETAEGGQA